MANPNPTKVFQGSPCRRGHPGLRYKNGGGCVDCAWENTHTPGLFQTPERRKDQQLKHQYGITLDTFDAMLCIQGGVCAICGGPPRTKKETYVVDHNHRTGRVRQLLCHGCNSGLGYFQDNAEILEKAATYLRLHDFG